MTGKIGWRVDWECGEPRNIATTRRLSLLTSFVKFSQIIDEGNQNSFSLLTFVSRRSLASKNNGFLFLLADSNLLKEGIRPSHHPCHLATQRIHGWLLISYSWTKFAQILCSKVCVWYWGKTARARQLNRSFQSSHSGLLTKYLLGPSATKRGFCVHRRRKILWSPRSSLPCTLFIIQEKCEKMLNNSLMSLTSHPFS